MTGRDIFEKISYSGIFVQNAINFAQSGFIKLDDSDSALEFLTLYLVLLSSSEFLEYDSDRLLEKYQSFKALLEKNGKISNNEFLSHPLENMTYILQDNICTMQK